MAYVTSSDMEDWIGTVALRQLSNLDQSAVSIDTDAVDEAIADAEAEVNAALGVRHTLPLASPYPAVVVSLTKRLTRWYLWDRQPNEPAKSVLDGFQRDRELLRQIRKGEVDLGLDTAGEVATVTSSPRARIHGSTQTGQLSRAKLGVF